MADGLVIEEREDFALASVMARRGVAAARIGAALGLALPERPGCVAAGELGAIATGPGCWLVLREADDPDHADRLRAALAGLASVSDVSSGYARFRLSGPAARRLLQRGAPIDLHPDSFAPGSAATTLIAHIGVIVWHMDATGFDCAVFRSLSGSFRHWLDEAAATLQ